MDTKTLTRVVAILAFGQLVMMASAFAAVLFLPIPDKNETSVSLLIGAIVSQSTTVIAYFFGRTDGERKKDQTINAMADSMKAVADTSATGASA